MNAGWVADGARRRPSGPGSAWAAIRHALKRRIARISWSMAGLPNALRGAGARSSGPQAVLRRAYARLYWRRGPIEWVDLVLAILAAPIVIPTWAARLAWRNRDADPVRRHRAPLMQWVDQLRLYAAAGVLPPAYYVFDLYRRPTADHARSFLYRFESKGGLMQLLKDRSPPTSIVSDKVAFEKRCRAHGIAAIPILAASTDGRFDWFDDSAARTHDWIVKPVDGKGGKGIERWDRQEDGTFVGPHGERLDADRLADRVARLPVPSFIQPRIVNHDDLKDLANGALSTIRALSCLDEDGRPELVGAVLRMAIGANRVVDNFHAGGIASAIDLATGRLGPASNLGIDGHLGWLDRHPDSGASITGRIIPCWDRFAPFVERAHRAFADRTIIGWDIAIAPDGPIVVEANGAPDLDIMQRIPGHGLVGGRLGFLLAHHVGKDG